MGFGGFERDRPLPRPMAEINVTPLVDVMLVLLVIFILTAPLLAYALKVDLPQVKAAPAGPAVAPVQVEIDAAGAIHLNAQPVDVDTLRARLAEFAARTPAPEVQLRADQAARFERVALVMSLAQEAGLTRIGFVTQPPAQAAGTR